MKNLIVFHYHYLPGGVTDVVSSAIISYMQKSKLIQSVTIVGGRTANVDRMLAKIHHSIAEEKRECVQWQHLPSIDYLENLSPNDSTESIKKELLNRFGSDENTWWIHNYHLGKNPYLTKALLDISKNEKQKMVFHIHDFPECSRFTLLNNLRTFIKEDLYPLNDNVHYAVINKRDYNYLRKSGLHEERISLLENPISPVYPDTEMRAETLASLSGEISTPFPSWKKNKPYMLYPVRAIRRKNIAEAALLAVLSDKNLIITLPGESDAEKQYSHKCREIFNRGLSPGMFGIGFAIEDHGISFQQLISSASMIISTSVQEGFGYLFLNSMNWGKALLAKDLDILESFKEHFGDFPAFFYDQISIPLSEIEKSKLLNLYNKKFNSSAFSDNPAGRNKMKNSMTQIISEEYTDFSYLSLEMQVKILEKLKFDDNYRELCRKINKKIINKIHIYFAATATPNRDVLQKNWSFESYCQKSEKILMKLDTIVTYMEQQQHDQTISETMKGYFTTPEYFRLLYDE